VGDKDVEVWIYVKCCGEFCLLLVAEAGMMLHKTYYSIRGV
jgi:hypothetical protein